MLFKISRRWFVKFSIFWFTIPIFCQKSNFMGHMCKCKLSLWTVRYSLFDLLYFTFFSGWETRRAQKIDPFVSIKFLPIPAKITQWGLPTQIMIIILLQMVWIYNCQIQQQWSSFDTENLFVLDFSSQFCYMLKGEL